MKLLLLVTAFLLILPRVEDPDAASIGGRVTEATGTPIAGARISVRNKFTREFEVTKTWTDGFYRIEGLRQGRYSVVAQAEDYGCTWVLDVPLYRGKHTNLDLVLASRKDPSDNCIEAIRSAQ